MFDFLKILIEEPAWLRKFVLFVIRFLLNIFFSYRLYVWMIGTPTLLDLKDIDGIFLFLVSGKILIPIILYFISEVFLFQFLAELPLIPLDYFAKKIDLTKPDIVFVNILRWLLVKFRFIEIDPKTNMTLAGKNINSFHNFLIMYNKKETEDEIQTIRYSLVNKVMHLYFVFICMYVFLFDIHMKNNALNYILIFLSIILPVLYFEIHIIIDFLNKSSKELLLGVNQLKIQKVLLDYMQSAGLAFVSTDEKNIQSPKFITYNNKDYFIQLYYHQMPINEVFLEGCKELCFNSEKRMLLITNCDLTPRAKELLVDYKQSIILLRFDNESELIRKLESVFVKKSTY